MAEVRDEPSAVAKSRSLRPGDYPLRNLMTEQRREFATRLMGPPPAENLREKTPETTQDAGCDTDQT